MEVGLIQRICDSGVIDVEDSFSGTAQGIMKKDKFNWGIPVGSLVFISINKKLKLTIKYIDDVKSREFKSWKRQFGDDVCWFEDENGYSGVKTFTTKIQINFNSNDVLIKSATKC